MVSVEDVKRAITDKTILITIMHANNEVGTIMPTAEIGRLARERKIIFHVDAVQSFGKIPVNVDELGADLLTISAHKVYGLKGPALCIFAKGRPGDRLSFMEAPRSACAELARKTFRYRRIGQSCRAGSRKHGTRKQPAHPLA